jgi:hypothetical protein
MTEVPGELTWFDKDGNPGGTYPVVIHEEGDKRYVFTDRNQAGTTCKVEMLPTSSGRLHSHTTLTANTAWAVHYDSEYKDGVLFGRWQTPKGTFTGNGRYEVRRKA